MDKVSEMNIFKKDKDNKLICLVKSKPILYDSSHPEYRKIVEKYRAWKEISDTLDTPIPVIKKRWKHFRDHYKKKEKLPQSKSKSSWEYMPLLSFLSKSSEKKETILNNFGTKVNGTFSANTASTSNVSIDHSHLPKDNHTISTNSLANSVCFKSLGHKIDENIDKCNKSDENIFSTTSIVYKEDENEEKNSSTASILRNLDEKYIKYRKKLNRKKIIKNDIKKFNNWINSRKSRLIASESKIKPIQFSQDAVSKSTEDTEHRENENINIKSQTKSLKRNNGDIDKKSGLSKSQESQDRDKSKCRNRLTLNDDDKRHLASILKIAFKSLLGETQKTTTHKYFEAVADIVSMFPPLLALKTKLRIHEKLAEIERFCR